MMQTWRSDAVVIIGSNSNSSSSSKDNKRDSVGNIDNNNNNSRRFAGGCERYLDQQWEILITGRDVDKVGTSRIRSI